jgi:hypothetical protein
MPFIDYAELKRRIPIEEAIPLLGLSVKQHGSQWRGPCSSCKSGGDRALVITQGKGFFCFSAKTGGDVIALTQHVRGGTSNEAASFLAGRSTVPEEQRGVKEAVRSFQAPATNLAAIADRLDREHEECVKLNLSSDTLKNFGGGYEKRGVARGNVIVQLHSADGTLRGYVGIGKPWFPPDVNLQEFVFNWHRQDDSELYLMRSPLEVMSAFDSGITNAISFLTPDISALQLRYLAELCEKRGATLIL